MAENPFRKLANRLGSQGAVTPLSDGAHLTDVLQEHLEMIAAAHASNHVSSHYSRPNQIEPSV